MAVSLGRRIAWSVAVSLPVAVIVHDHVVCIVPAPIANAGSTVSLINEHESVAVLRRIDFESTEHGKGYVVFKSPYDSRGKARGVAKIAGVPGDIYIERSSDLQSIQRLHPGQVMLSDDADDHEHKLANGLDSREFGPLPTVMVEGRPVAVIWPPSSVRWLS